LAVGVADLRDQVVQFGELRVGVLGAFAEEVLEPFERFAAGLDLVGGVEDRLTEHDEPEQFADLERAVLAVLAGDREAAPGVGPLPVAAGAEPRGDDRGLPQVRDEPVVRREEDRVAGVVGVV
jgi:hypothetical protein